MAEKTYEPTPRHLAEMRRKGQVATSPELTGAVTLLVAVYFLGSRLVHLLTTLMEIMRGALTSLTRAEFTIDVIHEGAVSIASRAGLALLPFMLLLGITGTAIAMAQTRGLVSTYRLRPDVKRLNPLSGMKRIFSVRGMFETGKGLLKMAVLAVVLYFTMRNVPERLSTAGISDIRAGVSIVGESMANLARQAALLLLIAAVLDYLFQRRQHRKEAKMTREQVMEELKNAEGQPLIRAKIREMQRRWSRQRMMQQLAHADVVVTNPTHLAIALRYEAKKMSAPTVVAKGKGAIAEQIVKRAREHHIPIMQNVPLARALINVELEAQIPFDLYQAVAEVYAFVYRLRGMHRQQAQGEVH